MRDSLGCKRFAHGELQACLLWVVSSECFEAGFAFRKADIILFKLQMSLPCCSAGEHWHSMSWHCGYQALGPQTWTPSWFPPSACPSDFFLYVCLFVFPKEWPQNKWGKEQMPTCFFAPIRPEDLSLLQREAACGGCGTCWGNAMGVLQQGDLHSFWQKGIASSKPKWEQKHPLFPILFPSQSAGNFSACRSKGDWRSQRQRVIKHRNPTSSSSSPWAEKGWGGWGRPWG